MTTATAVHSEPVPEVVGTMIKGITRCVRLIHSLPNSRRKAVCSCSNSTRTALAVSSTEPPPMATTPSQPSSRACAASRSTNSKEESCGMPLSSTIGIGSPIICKIPCRSIVPLTNISGFFTRSLPSSYGIFSSDHCPHSSLTGL